MAIVIPTRKLVKMKKDSSSESMKIKMRGLVDMLGGKPSCNVTEGLVSPTLTCGRASVNDIHVVCYKLKRRKSR